MNKIVLLGKLIKDPELKTIENGEKVFISVSALRIMRYCLNSEKN